MCDRLKGLGHINVVLSLARGHRLRSVGVAVFTTWIISRTVFGAERWESGARASRFFEHSGHGFGPPAGNKSIVDLRQSAHMLINQPR